MMWLRVVLPEPRRPEQQHVIERLAALLGRADEDLELLACLGLADVVAQLPRPQRTLERFFLWRLTHRGHGARRGGCTGEVVGLNAHGAIVAAAVQLSARQRAQRQLDALAHRHVGRQ